MVLSIDIKGFDKISLENRELESNTNMRLMTIITLCLK